MYDLLILNAMIIDGTSSPWFYGDIGIVGEKISAIGDLKRCKARKIIDVKGLFACPGFVDIHSHSDFHTLVDNKCESKIRQGVTTEVIGNCGYSLAPLLGEALEESRKSHFELYGIEAGWQTVEEYLQALERSRPSVNYAMLVGHGAIRKSVMGYEKRDPTEEELSRMKKLLDQAMKQGAFGMSTGLIYSPGSFAKTGEIIELCKVVAKRNGIYTTHMRSESEYLEESVLESIEIGEKSKVSVQISHHKACGRKYFGKVNKTLEMIKEARSRGIDVTCDVYPYTATATDLDAILPDWVHEGGIQKLIERLKDKNIREKIKKQIDPVQKAMSGYENLYITYTFTEKNKQFQGKSIAEISKILNKDPLDTAFDLIVEEKSKVGMMRFAMDEEDVKKVISSPFSMIGSDGSALSVDGVLSHGHPHPRNFGTFPRVIARYVKEFKVITLEQAIYKMTSFPARRVGIFNRGIIRPKMAADIVIFDFDKIQDLATYENPKHYPQGIIHVIVNGEPTIFETEHTKARAGKILRKS
ncbi:N-acyl-D-amino-acid deacylase family protein [Thermotoga profunda]|uniref:N-acyl-D-amino-acid deacylase family protein n=1 Tax=Thermotoga profunda TaxID=1508420 RepID=UPI0005973BCF|nr:D-aminoacylase [Thermotoga profunda]